ncbi:MAG: DNA repair protein RecO [Eggerthellaceae bacterium]|jgi:DNA repair protein RecO (recombination protein O)
MANRSYTARAIVIKKTKLGETDLILTLLGENGAQIRAVAKGARKPQSSFSSRLELYSYVEVLLHEGKKLAIISEAKLIDAHEQIRHDFELASTAACIAEFLAKSTEEDLEEPQLFEMTRKAFDLLSKTERPSDLGLCAAFLIKACAFLGFGPQLDTCSLCGKTVSTETGSYLHFSLEDGGLLCPACALKRETLMVKAQTIAWQRVLLRSTFETILDKDIPQECQIEIFQLLKQWINYHLGAQIKSIDFLLAELRA